MSGGRPSKYDPAFCDQAIEWMEQGYSIAGLAGKLRVSRDTIYQWAKDHEPFSDALSVARGASAAWWEDRAIELATGQEGSGNPTIIVFGLKNRVADEWRDKTTIEGPGPNGEHRVETISAVDKLKGFLNGIAKRSGETGEPAPE